MISKIYSPKWTIQVFIEEQICALAICTNTLSSAAIPILVTFFQFWDSNNFGYGFGKSPFIVNNCSVNNCFITNDRYHFSQINCISFKKSWWTFNCLSVKGIVSIILSYPLWKYDNDTLETALSDQYMVEDICLGLKGFNSDYSFMFSHSRNTLIFDLSLIRQSFFQGIVVNGVLPLHRGSL